MRESFLYVSDYIVIPAPTTTKYPTLICHTIIYRSADRVIKFEFMDYARQVLEIRHLTQFET